MNVGDYFKFEEKVKILEQQGFTVKLVDHTNYYDTYQNNVDEEKVQVYKVFKGDTEFTDYFIGNKYNLKLETCVDLCFNNISNKFWHKFVRQTVLDLWKTYGSVEA